MKGFNIHCNIPLDESTIEFLEEVSANQQYIKVRRVPSENYCTDCAFVEDCAGDGDGTPVEGLECHSGYVWKIVE